jgi:competence ComEA-like helix-hairpin-helix protein
MTLYAMQEELAIEIHEYIQENIITDSTDLLELESVDEHMLKCWDKNLDDMRVDINSVEEYELIKIKGIGKKLAKLIIKYKKELNGFKSIEELEQIEGIGKNKLVQLKSRFKIGV